MIKHVTFGTLGVYFNASYLYSCLYFNISALWYYNFYWYLSTSFPTTEYERVKWFQAESCEVSCFVINLRNSTLSPRGGGGGGSCV